jgi:hypothetical protein
VLAGVFSEQARIKLDVVDMAVEGSQLGLDLWDAGDLIDVGAPGILTCFAVVVIGRDKGTSLIFTVCEDSEPRGHARKRLMQAA